MNNKRQVVRATLVEDAWMWGLRIRMAPIGLQTYAADFVSSAKAVEPPSVPFAPARIYLACHALELALKAFLSLKGRSLEQLAGGKFGHDLECLLKEAEQHGLDKLVNFDEPQKSQIRRASNYYKRKIFEYPSIHEAACAYPGSPNTAMLISAAEALVAALKVPCLNAN